MATLLLGGPVAFAQSKQLDVSGLPGQVVDDAEAEFNGTFKSSTQIGPYVGAGYRTTTEAGQSATFTFTARRGGEQILLVAYSANSNRAKKVAVSATLGDQNETYDLDQTRPPDTWGPFHKLGRFTIVENTKVVVEIKLAGPGALIVDAVALVTPKQLDEWKSKTAPAVVAKPAKPKPPVTKPAEEKPAAPPATPPAPFVRKPSQRTLHKLTPSELDTLVAKHLPSVAEAALVDDETFLRRVTLDLVGRQPTLDEQARFRTDAASDKRTQVVDRLLKLPEFSSNWANYWSDAIGSRQQEPELTFHDYKPLKRWLAERIEAGQGWDETVAALITAKGQIKSNPASTFIGFHQGEPNRLAGETARLFLGTQIACAQCHDHPFVPLSQETFHGMAAFFVRVQAKIAQLDSDGIDVLSKPAGEQKLPPQSGPNVKKGKKTGGEMPPTVLTGEVFELGIADEERRAKLAAWLTASDNPLFAKAYVNRIWTRTIGQPFTPRIDDIGAGSTAVWDDVWTAVADHFAATGFDHRETLRLIVNTRAYQRPIATGSEPAGASDVAFATARVVKLRGDEVFDSLITALEIPNVTPPREKKTTGVRFPPPPKSTRDLVQAAFGYDPSNNDSDIPRTLTQAMFLMNNKQVRAQINGQPESGTVLSKLLASESDDTALVTRLFERVLARQPTSQELSDSLTHMKAAANRITASEDLLWGLLNTAEFVTRK